MCCGAGDRHARVSLASIRWFAREPGRFATCASTQDALLRLHMTLAQNRSAEAAWVSLAGFVAHTRHEFWEAAFGYTDLKRTHITGAKQVTDAWLVELARRQGGRLGTFDAALARWHSDVVTAVSVL